MRRTIILFAAASLLGCATPIPQGTPKFSGLTPPDTGMARLYVFRPSFEDGLKREAPLLLIESAPVASVAHGSFTQVNLSPGKHVLEFKAGITELATWNKKIEINAEATKTYFLAVWMNIDGGRGFMFLPVAGAVLPVPIDVTRATGLLHEFVTEAQAVESLNDLFFMAPALPRY